MKLLSPLLSFSASGSLANLITFLNIRGHTYAKIKQGPIGGTSAAQLEQRAKFKAACDFSHTLTSEEKAYWHSQDPRSASCSWFNNFMSAYIVDPGQFAVSMIKSIQHFTFTLDGSDIIDLIEINEVDLDCSVMICSGHLSNSTYTTRAFAAYEFIDSTHIRAARRSHFGAHACIYDVHVVEFESSVIQSLQFKLVVHESGTLNITTEIDEVNLNKSFVLHYGEYVFSDYSYMSAMVSHSFVDSTHIITTRSFLSGKVSSYFVVLEFK